MNIRPITLGLALCLGVATAATAQTPVTTGESDVRAHLMKSGYDIERLQLKNGFWRVDATDPEGKLVRLRIDPAGGEVYSKDVLTPMTEQDVMLRLREEGFTGVREVHFDPEDRLWTAEANDAVGDDYEIEVDAFGEVVAINDD